VTIDVGTGDGRAVLAAAALDPRTLAIGMDANAAAMAEASRRAAKSSRKGGTPNAAFVLAAAEAPPAELAGIASRVTVQLPWGSLLRGCVGADPAVAAGVAGLVGPAGSLELLLAPSAKDGLDGLPIEPTRVIEAAASAFAEYGLELVEGRLATTGEVRASGSTWARRLGTAQTAADGTGPASTPERAVTLVRLVRTGHR
jgi:16S rRNA (adenine(1408)-N(1))-methyltransferase